MEYDGGNTVKGQKNREEESEGERARVRGVGVD